MKRLGNIFFYLAVGLIPFGLILRIEDYEYGAAIFLLGLIILALFFLIQLITKYRSKNNILLYVLLILMTITLFAKYLYYGFWNYPSLIIIPIFIFIAIRTIYKKPHVGIKLKIAIVLFFILTIPMFGFNFHRSPIDYIPPNWYNRYGNAEGVHIELPFTYKYEKTEQICDNAFELFKQKKYSESIKRYKEARKIEPQNPIMLFELSEVYAKINELEVAIAVLDTAISIDSSYSEFYNNRGLLYYKLDENEKALDDYKRAIALDSTTYVAYGNIALIYYQEQMYDKACEAIKEAEKLGINLDHKDNKELKTIKRLHCN